MKGQLTRRLGLGMALYAAMVAGAVAIAAFRGDGLLTRPSSYLPSLWAAPVPPLLVQLGASVLLGTLLAWLTVASTQLLVRRVGWARALRAEFRAALEGATDRDVVLLALASGTAEELLFRGAVQPMLGLTLTSLLFGAVHFVPSRALLPWTAWAGVMGLLLGLIYETTGSILGCVLAHVAINAINLRRIVRFDPSLDDDPDPHAPPSIVSRKRTRSRG